MNRLLECESGFKFLNVFILRCCLQTSHAAFMRRSFKFNTLIMASEAQLFSSSWDGIIKTAVFDCAQMKSAAITAAAAITRSAQVHLTFPTTGALWQTGLLRTD